MKGGPPREGDTETKRSVIWIPGNGVPGRENSQVSTPQWAVWLGQGMEGEKVRVTGADLQNHLTHLIRLWLFLSGSWAAFGVLSRGEIRF